MDGFATLTLTTLTNVYIDRYQKQFEKCYFPISKLYEIEKQ